jgi:hypothetical protein
MPEIHCCIALTVHHMSFAAKPLRRLSIGVHKNFRIDLAFRSCARALSFIQSLQARRVTPD